MYHIKIEDLETGKVVADGDTDCVIASIHLPAESDVQNVAAVCATAPTVMDVSTNLLGLNRNVMNTLLDDMLKEVTHHE